MPEQNNALTKPEPAAGDQSKYLIHSRMEIAAILATLQRAGSMVTAYFGGGSDFILTSILEVRPEQGEVLLDYGADNAANQRALKAERITFVSAHERIKIQFVGASLRHARFEARDAFSTTLPQELLRLQRREYFRIATPLTRPLKCVIGPQGAALGMPPEVHIVDISCGGIAIIDPSSAARIEAGTCLRDCRVQLPDIGTISADILVKSTFELTLRNGARHRHVGCEFVAMPERERALIQRYINKMERERKNRSAGR